MRILAGLIVLGDRRREQRYFFTVLRQEVDGDVIQATGALELWQVFFADLPRAVRRRDFLGRAAADLFATVSESIYPEVADVGEPAVGIHHRCDDRQMPE